MRNTSIKPVPADAHLYECVPTSIQQCNYGRGVADRHGWRLSHTWLSILDEQTHAEPHANTPTSSSRRLLQRDWRKQHSSAEQHHRAHHIITDCSHTGTEHKTTRSRTYRYGFDKCVCVCVVERYRGHWSSLKGSRSYRPLELV